MCLTFLLQTGLSRVKEYVDNFRETKFALESNRVKCLRSFNNMPGDGIKLIFFFQFPDVFTECCFRSEVGLPERSAVLIPSPLPVLREACVCLRLLVNGEVVLVNECDCGAVHDVSVDTVRVHGAGGRPELTVTGGRVLSCWRRRGRRRRRRGRGQVTSSDWAQ